MLSIISQNQQKTIDNIATFILQGRNYMIKCAYRIGLDSPVYLQAAKYKANSQEGVPIAMGASFFNFRGGKRFYFCIITAKGGNLMEYFYRVLTQLEIFSVMILLGVFAVKTNAMNEKSLGDLSKMIMRLILPVMIFHKSINGATKADIMSSSSEVILSSFLMFGVLFMVGYLLKKTFSLTGNYGRVYQAAAMFGNVGFIGIPLILGILPERGMLYMALFFIVDQIVLWSIGYYMTLPEEKLAHASLKSNIKNIMSPAMIGIVIAIIFILTEWKLPATLNKALGAVGDATTPLSLIYIGGSFCYSNVRKFISRLEYYAIVAGKMIVAPLVVFLALRAMNVQEEIVTVITTLTGVPSMAAIAMFARTNGSDEDCAIGAIMITTIFSLFTLPLVAYITGNLL